MTTATSTVLKKISERPLVKNKINPHFKNRYADLDACQSVVLPVLYEHGWFLKTTTSVETFVGGSPMILLTMDVIDDEGVKRMSSQYPVANVDCRPQEIGSAMTYARRYCLCALFNLTADEDDDGNAASGTTSSSVPTNAASRPGLRRLS